MTDKEKAEEYADKILSDSKHPFILSKEKVKAFIVKVYLDSLKCCEHAYDMGFMDGKKDSLKAIACEQEHVKMLEKEIAKLLSQTATAS